MYEEALREQMIITETPKTCWGRCMNFFRVDRDVSRGTEFNKDSSSCSDLPGSPGSTSPRGSASSKRSHGSVGIQGPGLQNSRTSSVSGALGRAGSGSKSFIVKGNCESAFSPDGFKSSGSCHSLKSLPSEVSSSCYSPYTVGGFSTYPRMQETFESSVAFAPASSAAAFPNCRVSQAKSKLFYFDNFLNLYCLVQFFTDL